MTSPIDEFWGRPSRADDHPTQPIVPPAAAADPPPSGLAADPAGAPPDADVDWQAKYEEQAKRTRIFMVSTVAAAAALIGSLFFSVANAGSQSPGPAAPPGGSGQMGQLPGGSMGDGLRGGTGGDGDLGMRGFDHHHDGAAEGFSGPGSDRFRAPGQGDPFDGQGRGDPSGDDLDGSTGLDS